MNRIYAIDGENRVQRIDAVGKPIEGAFTSLEEFALLVTDWPLRRLVEIWNKLPGVRPLSRFENRGVAVHRIWSALHSDQQPARAQRPLRRRRVRESKTQLVLRLLRQ